MIHRCSMTFFKTFSKSPFSRMSFYLASLHSFFSEVSISFTDFLFFQNFFLKDLLFLISFTIFLWRGVFVYFQASHSFFSKRGGLFLKFFFGELGISFLGFRFIASPNMSHYCCSRGLNSPLSSKGIFSYLHFEIFPASPCFLSNLYILISVPLFKDMAVIFTYFPNNPDHAHIVKTN